MLQYNKDYVHGSHGPNNFDCAGLVWYVYYNVLGIDIYNQGFGLSTTTKIMTSNYGIITLYNENSLFKDLKIIKKGDILLFHRQSKEDTIPKPDNKYPGHCGIYLGNNNFIHCSRKYKSVLINNLNKDKYWNKKLVASKNIISYEKILKK